MSESSRQALLLIDLQAGFFDAPALQRQQSAVVQAANTLSQSAKRAGSPVFVITTVHSRDRSTWTLNMLDDGQGYLFNGDPTTQIVEGLDVEHATRIEKTRDSAFFGTDLMSRLRNLQVERLVLAGVSTHGCIAQTARDAYAHNVRVVIATDAVADERQDYMTSVLEQIDQDRQADLRTISEIIDSWQHRHNEP